MKYLIVGAGGTGGSIAFHMSKANKDVCVVARGEHLQAIQEKGLGISKQGSIEHTDVHAVSESECNAAYDVIFVCVKYYSLSQIYPLIRRVSHAQTIVIPILNIYGTAEEMAKQLPGLNVLHGCIYLATSIKKPGVLIQEGSICKVVFGSVDGEMDALYKIQEDLVDSGIECEVSLDIRSATLQKFSFVSPAAAVGVYYDVSAKAFQKDGEVRNMFVACIKEIQAIAKKKKIYLPDNIVEINLCIMDALDPKFTTSLQKDIKANKNNEMQGIIHAVVKMGEEVGFDCVVYKQIIEAIQL